MEKLKFCFGLLLFFLIHSAIVYSQDDPTVYVTRSGSKYHASGCIYLRKSAVPIKLSEAIKRYSPCSRCRPATSSVRAQKTSVQSDSIAPPIRPSNRGNSPILNEPGEKAVGVTPRGQTIYEGPRGGHFHYTKSGKKIYERKKN